MPLRTPPGRAGRLWLRDRLRTGRLAADLLDRKLHILRAEQARFHLRADRTGDAWREAWQRAEALGLRAAVMGGRREMRLLATAPADLSVGWASVMGLRYPVEATCRFAPPSELDRSPGTTALLGASAAYQAAIVAGAAHAAARSACRLIDAEVIDTRRRLRAITERWLPSLEEALRDLSTRLEEAERAETARLRWIARRNEPTGGGP